MAKQFPHYRKKDHDTMKRYFDGFRSNLIRKTPMFEDEIKDLEKVYRSSLSDMNEDVKDQLSTLAYYMQNFLDIYNKREEVHEKLESLLEKTGGKLQEESTGGSNE